MTAKTIRKQAYNFRGMPLADHHILARGIRYSAIPIMSLEGIHDVFITEGTVDGEKFVDFITEYLLPVRMPFIMSIQDLWLSWTMLVYIMWKRSPT